MPGCCWALGLEKGMTPALTELATQREAPGALRDSLPLGNAGVSREEGVCELSCPFPGPQVIVLVYSFLRKAAWDYGRLALLIHNDR